MLNPCRRSWLARALAAAAALGSSPGPAGAGETGAADADAIRRGRPMRFPRDHGAHLPARIEWWYATGWLGDAAAPSHGFQLTFFRSATGLAAGLESRFAPRQLLFAHAALTTLDGSSPGKGQHVHDQRIARWSGEVDAARAPRARAALVDADVVLGNWRLQHQTGRWLASLPSREFQLQLQLQATQTPLLQGEAGFSRKGPQENQASHYYSLPQLAVTAQLQPGGASLSGRAWLDHEWSDELLHPQAVGWDWVGMNLLDGSALTAFVLRRADGSALWAGGSWRSAAAAAAGTPAQDFAPGQVQWRALRHWRSASSGARYPVAWALECPAGRFEVRALMDAQELDSRASTGAVYWEGLSELTDASGQRVGLGYLEMTGYASALKLG